MPIFVFGPFGGLIADRLDKRLVLYAAAPTLAVEFVTMVFVGYGSITFNAMAKTMLQAASAPMMRGRVMALWGLAWLGTTPIGGPLVGWIGQHLGARWSLVAGGVPTILIGVLCWPALRRLDRRVAARQPAGAAGAGVAAWVASGVAAEGSCASRSPGRAGAG